MPDQMQAVRTATNPTRSLMFGNRQVVPVKLVAPSAGPFSRMFQTAPGSLSKQSASTSRYSLSKFFCSRVTCILFNNGRAVNTSHTQCKCADKGPWRMICVVHFPGRVVAEHDKGLLSPSNEFTG